MRTNNKDPRILRSMTREREREKGHCLELPRQTAWAHKIKRMAAGCMKLCMAISAAMSALRQHSTPMDAPRARQNRTVRSTVLIEGVHAPVATLNETSSVHVWLGCWRRVV